jgi:hypothetical protein
MKVSAYGTFYRALHAMSTIDKARRIVLGIGDYLHSLVGGPRRCCDCNVMEGELHQLGCDQEVCPFCGGQVISCMCIYRKFFGINWQSCVVMPREHLKVKWDQVIRDKGRIPFVLYPNLCAKCGKKWPEMFSIPNSDWQRYVAPDQRKNLLCKPCYLKIKNWIDAKSGAPERIGGR